MHDLMELFLLFVQVGGLTFGGGYAMLPILTKELVDKRGWASDTELTDYFAIGQCTPGVIALNVATFIGTKRKGLVGAVVASIGVVFVPIIIITIIAAFLRGFADYPVVKSAFAGIRVSVCVLILNSVLRLWKKSVTDLFGFLIFLAAFILSVFFKVSPVILVIGAGAAGVILGRCQRGGKTT